MNIQSFLLPLLTVISPAFAMDGWLSNIDKAMEQAQKDNKLILVEFTGSDWCPPCKALRKDVFPSPEFKKIADKNLVMVELDYPRKTEQSEEQKKYNGEMAKKYEIAAYPTVYLLNTNGETVWMRRGGGTKKRYLEDLEQGIKNANPLMETLEKLKKTEGQERLAILDKAWKMMSRDLKKKNENLLKEIMALDTDDTLGYARDEQKRLQIEKQEAELRNIYLSTILPLAREGKTTEAMDQIKKLAAREDLLPQARQSIYMTAMYGICMENSDLPAGIQALKDTIKIDPTSERAKSCEDLIKYMEANKETVLKHMEENKTKMEQMRRNAEKKKQ